MFRLNSDVFYNEANYIEDYELFFTSSEYFLKYIGNTQIVSNIGTAKIVEIGRCESNMENILVSLGFIEDYMIFKWFAIFHYKNKPIWINLSRISEGKKFTYDNVRNQLKDQVIEY